MRKINLKQFPKVKLIERPSQIQYLKNISKQLGVEVYVKRDDLLAVGYGGNKLRKLEYLLGEAKKQEATHIFTIGAVQSNHARMTAIAAMMNGFEAELFLKNSVPIRQSEYHTNGNVLLNKIIDVTIHPVENNKHAYERIAEREKELLAQGERPYVIPVGGSNALGTLGYMDAYFEILNQQNEVNVKFDWIATATGSGGTHAGLAIGQALSPEAIPVKGYSVEPNAQYILDHTLAIANEALKMIGEETLLKAKDLYFSEEYSGEAYGIPSPIHIDTIKWLAKYEGIFLDPVYTSKAFTALIMDIKNGVIKAGSKVLYVHTGGLPGIFAYPQYF